ncbi:MULTISPECIES: type II toxin-antitoxin system HicB family antitoxin [Halolamina]|uniref:Predicted nuclease of the RNAse H fold, HicB family n=1 Tax=Halolamina pelagica TaxID=699431 RepID=A0A1I5VP14_9EURY|nr:MULTISPECIES: type II toxin-antitoxin system HicB family antitoxin [Halolamina]NHX37836.1 type II toxin-antitoxin system HicB family antitoxin [Halolamina sp. R1-12]SFQ09298.1 Predicted nuclease of the RNAse H fold, HicB family [Halolamina pelagica]
MSTDTPEANHPREAIENISLTLSEDGEIWVAKDEDTGVASQGETREEALEMLDEAVALHKGEIGHEPTDEELRELGIDPANNESGSLEDSEIFE